MAESQPFKVLKQRERQKVEEPYAGDDVLQFYGLRRLYASALTLQPIPYLRNLPGDIELRKSDLTDLAPLADIFPSAQRPDLKPFSAGVLRSAFTLQPGTFALSERDRGVPLPSAGLRPELGASAASGDKKERKKAKKEKRDKKDKKEKKDRKDKDERKRKRSESVQ